METGDITCLSAERLEHITHQAWRQPKMALRGLQPEIHTQYNIPTRARRLTYQHLLNLTRKDGLLPSLLEMSLNANFFAARCERSCVLCSCDECTILYRDSFRLE